MNLKQRISEINRYISTCERLEEIVGDQDTGGIDLKDTQNYLEGKRKFYQSQISWLEDKKKIEEEIRQKRENFISKYSESIGAEKAAEIYDAPYTPTYLKATRSFMEGMLIGAFACVSLPFSPKTSIGHLKEVPEFFESGFRIINMIKSRKEQRKRGFETAKIIRETEIAELRLEKVLEEKLGLPEKARLEMIERPELIFFALVNVVKEKYAPWLPEEYQD